MVFEFYWADYERFGSDGSLITLGRLMESRLKAEYGSDVRNVFICGHCRSLIPANKNLASISEEFEEHREKLKESPSIRLLKKKQELEIRFATVWPIAEEFRPDAEMLKLGTFHRFYRKVLVLLDTASNRLGKRANCNFEALLTAIRALESDLPKSLKDLALMYANFQK